MNTETTTAERKETEERRIHIFLIKFKEGVTQVQKEDIYQRYQNLAKECGGKKAGILSYDVEWNQDIRKGYELCGVSVFKNEGALQKFRAHPKHKEFTTLLSQVADWVVGDFSKTPEKIDWGTISPKENYFDSSYGSKLK